MAINLSKKDVIWSYIGTILSMSANVLMLPIIVYYLESDMLGLWYVFGSIGGIAVLFDFGFGVTFARNITYSWSGASTLKKQSVSFAEKEEPNYLLMKKVLKACKLVYLCISSFALLLLITIGSFYILKISSGMTGITHIIAWFIYSVAVFFNLFYGYFASFLRGVGAVAEANINTVIARGIQIVLTIVLLALGTGIIGVSLAYLSYGFVFRYLGKYKFYNYQRIGENLSRINTSSSLKEVLPLFKTVWYNGWREGLISISNYLCGYASTIICSLFLTLSETGTYSVSVQIAMAIAVVSSTLYTAMQPQLQAAYVSKDITKMKNSMAVILSSLFYLFILGVIFVILFFIPLLRYIKPESVVPVPILLAICLYQYILRYRDCYATYFSSTNRIPYLWAFVISSFLNIILSLIFLGPLDLGMWGLVSAQIISQSVFNFWYWPLKGNQELNINSKQMFFLGSSMLLINVKTQITSLGKGK